MNMFPLPNVNVGTGAYNPYANFFATGANTSAMNSYDVKIDHRWKRRIVRQRFTMHQPAGDLVQFFGGGAHGVRQAEIDQRPVRPRENRLVSACMGVLRQELTGGHRYNEEGQGSDDNKMLVGKPPHSDEQGADGGARKAGHAPYPVIGGHNGAAI